MERLYIVDVSSMFFRAFYAIRSLSNSKGLPTNAIYGFLSMIVKLLREEKPEYLAFCFDRKEPSFRAEIYPEYKANRSEMPEDLVPQIPYIRKLAELLGIPCFDLKGFEADDLIGSLVAFGGERGLNSTIVSGDKDFGQLVGSRVSILDTMKNIRYDAAGVIEKWGIPPEQMLDYLALIGDSSDNVPGVSGIGPKGAQKLLAEFGSLDNLFASLDKVANVKLREKLQAGRESAYLSKKLIAIRMDIPLVKSKEDLRMRPIQREALVELLTELDFNSFIKTLLGDVSSEPRVTAPVENAVAPIQASVESSASLSSTNVEMDLAQLDRWISKNDTVWAVDCERTLVFAKAAGDKSETVTVRGDRAELQKLLGEKQIHWKGYDLKTFWQRTGLDPSPVAWDHLMAAYVNRPSEIVSFAEVVQKYLGRVVPDLASPEQLLSLHLELETALEKNLQRNNGNKIYREMELPLIPILANMERRGISLDASELKIQSVALGKELKELESRIYEQAGGEVFNIGSPKQLAVILFTKMQIPPGKKTKTGYSTDNEVLEKLMGDYPICRDIIEYREVAKLKSTYVDALPQLIAGDGRIHTTYNQALTATGRLSSVNPNLQNIPIRTERGNRVRNAFVAADGNLLISSDYSQVELRVLAHLSEDPGLVRAFAENIDVHAATASEIFSVKLADVTPDMRRKAKAVNFGLAYGQGVFGLSETLGVPRAEASEIIDRYFARFRKVQEYMHSTVETAKKQGFVESVFGRRRYLDELQSKNGAVRKFGERAAINAPMQATASDLIKLAMIKVNASVRAPVLLQVHDELVLEAEIQQAQAICKKVQSEMESIGGLRVPLIANGSTGKNWGEL